MVVLKSSWCLGLPFCIQLLHGTLCELLNVANSDQRHLEQEHGLLEDYCQWETMNVTCRPGHVIVMQMARYGRMRFGRCMQEDHGHPGCSADVLPQLDARCSGRSSCLVSVPDQDLHALHPCSKELMPYLQASYTCVDSHSQNAGESCLKSGEVTVTGEEHGFLVPSPAADGVALVSSSSISVGSARCPWHVSVATGRRINVTLYNFGLGLSPHHLQPASPTAANADTNTNNMCGDALVIEETGESGRRMELTLCDSRHRQSYVYLSASHSFTIHFRLHGNTFSSLTSLFPFAVEFRGVGCADVTSVTNAWVQRQGDRVTVRCNYTGETFFLSCSDNTWLGARTNCSQAIASSISKVEVSSGVKPSRLPYGLFVVVGVGVALGVAVGIVLLFAFLIFFKRRDYRSPDSREESERPSPLHNRSSACALNCQTTTYLSPASYTRQASLPWMCDPHCQLPSKQRHLASASLGSSSCCCTCNQRRAASKLAKASDDVMCTSSSDTDTRPNCHCVIGAFPLVAAAAGDVISDLSPCGEGNGNEEMCRESSRDHHALMTSSCPSPLTSTVLCRPPPRYLRTSSAPSGYHGDCAAAATCNCRDALAVPNTSHCSSLSSSSSNCRSSSCQCNNCLLPPTSNTRSFTDQTKSTCSTTPVIIINGE